MRRYFDLLYTVVNRAMMSPYCFLQEGPLSIVIPILVLAPCLDRFLIFSQMIENVRGKTLCTLLLCCQWHT